MFAKIIESEIKWCEQNNGAMPEEFRKGFIAGLNQAIYLINAAKQRMVWKDGEMVDDEDLLDRDAELQRATDETVICPSCKGSGERMHLGEKIGCDACLGTGQIKPPSHR